MPRDSSTSSFSVEAAPIALAYAAVEARVRPTIDRVTRRVCPACSGPCCRFWYCRETAQNPWYAFVNRLAGSFPVPADWETRRDPFGLGPNGCDIRAGRYVFCYSYNCRRLLANLASPAARRTFQDLSDLLLAVNRLPGGRLLHELRHPSELAGSDLKQVAESLGDAFRRLPELEGRLKVLDPTPAEAAGQARRGVARELQRVLDFAPEALARPEMPGGPRGPLQSCRAGVLPRGRTYPALESTSNGSPITEA